MADPIIVRSRWVVEELLQAQRIHRRHGAQRVLLPAMHVLFGLVCLLGVFLVAFGRPSPMAILGITIGGYWPFAWFVLFPWWTRRQFKKRPDHNLEVTWSITDDGLETSSEHHKAQFTWAMIAKAVESPQGMLLHLNSRMFHWLPRHGFESEETWRAFGALVRQQVGTVYEVGKG